MMLRRRLVLCALSCLAAAGMWSCDMTERANRSDVTRVNAADKTNFTIDVDPIMRGTIAAETIVSGFKPAVLRGYGIVVDLAGTGSRTAPAPIRAQVLQDLARLGFGSDGHTNLPNPEELLNSPNTAIVAVEGVVPPGAVKGAHFDLRVYAVPGSATTSLEGGRLAYVDLRPGPFRVGSQQSKLMATGKGPVVVNPFSTPNAVEKDNIDRLVGRVLDGGTVQEDLVIRLRLATPSHNRAKVIEAAVNSSFPPELGFKEPTARGRTDELIDIAVPPSYQDKTDDFVQLLRHAPVQLSDNSRLALSVQKGLLANPGSAEGARWRWQVLGKQALPMIQELYDYSEEQPRFAALTAGAALGDPLAVKPLEDLAISGDRSLRVRAIRLLGDMNSNPSIDMVLRPLLDDEDLDIRLEAYDALAKRADPAIRRIDVDGKFLLDLVPSKTALVYVIQTGKPRIAIFGGEGTVKMPLTVREWDGRLILRGDEGEERIDVFYRPADGREPQRMTMAPNLPEIAYFFGHGESRTAAPSGLGLSYSDTISALHGIWRQGYANADFRAQQDRLLAEIMRTEPITRADDRPDFDSESANSTDPSLAGLPMNSQNPEPAAPTGLEPGSRPADTVPR